ncbi:MAG: hypothetical protein PHN38_04035 [Sulfurospirillaceae bacterium]|nr:hypothetical protein [Sulfurospirillaceae bacterium]
MKITLICQSLLLAEALKSFLGDKIVSFKQCDFVISDQKIEIDKPVFLISSIDGDLILPFSKSALILGLEKFYRQRILKKSDMPSESLHIINEEILEDKINLLTENFRQELIKTIKEYCEN